jgi:eukaryotic-like serine/threonine-protein kinase
MKPDDRAEKVAMLFEEGVEITDPEKRARYLDTVCAGCDDLRKDVEVLLQAHEASGRFLRGGTPPSGGRSGQAGDVPAIANVKPGDRIGPYRLIGQIGEGATSTVFVAEQEEPVRRWVALKIIKPGMDTRQVLLRFALERQALALMDHGGIAKLLDAGATSAGRPFFVMELVSGIGITSYCDEHRLTIPQRLALFVEICTAVLHAHQRGIIHRDLKPDNILVAHSDGRAGLKIIDFGIAKVLHAYGIENATRTGAMPFLGTPAYMSPEQAQMTSPDLDTRTDIYSLGAVLYELLTGRPPFDHEQLMAAGIEEMCRILRTQEPAAPSERFSQLPSDEQAAVAAARGGTVAELRRMLTGDLDWITLKALEKKREQRYATAAGLAEDIGRHLEHLPVLAAAHTRRYRFAKLVRRNRKAVVVASAVAVLLLVSAFVSLQMAVNARSSAREARGYERVATTAERQSHRALVAMHVSSGFSAVGDRSYDKAVLWFAHAARVAGAGEDAHLNVRRALAWLSRVSIPTGAFMLPPTFRQLEFSPDSQYLLAQGGGHTWSLWDGRTEAVVPWSTEVTAIKTAAWSPEGSRLALVIPDGEIRVYDVAGESRLQSVRMSPAPAAIGFTADSRRLVAGNAGIQVFSLDEPGPPEIMVPDSPAVVGLLFSRRSTEVAAVTDDARVRMVPIGGRSAGEVEGARSFLHRPFIRTDACPSKSNYRGDFLEAAKLSLPVVTADGARLVTRSGTYAVSFWDVASGDLVQRIDGACCSCRFATSADMGLLAVSLQGGKVGIWDIATGAQRQLLPSRGTCILDLAFGWAGRGVITAEANGLARIWSVADGLELQSPLHHCTDVDKVAFAPDGGRVATAQADGLVRIWNVLAPAPDEHGEAKEGVPTVVCRDGSGQKFVLTKEPGWAASIRQLTVYSTASGEPLGPALRFDDQVESAAFSPDSRLLAVAIGGANHEGPAQVEFRDLSDLRLAGGKVELRSTPASIAWNPIRDDVAVICRSGELLVLQPGNEAAIRWQTPSAPSQGRTNPRVEYTADGAVLVSLDSGGMLQVHDAASGELRYPPLSTPGGFWSFTLSGDGHYLATTTVSGDVAVWNLADGLMIGGILRHADWVYRSRFSPDQETLVTAAHDGRVRLWDWRAGTLRTAPLVHPSEVYDATFTPDNRWVLTACWDGHVRIWEPHQGQLLSPPIKVGQQALNIEVSQEGRHAVIGSLGREVSILNLDSLLEDLPIGVPELCLLGEMVSGCIVEQGTIRTLTTAEWLERYEQSRRLDPEVLRRAYSFGVEKRTLAKSIAMDVAVSAIAP